MKNLLFASAMLLASVACGQSKETNKLVQLLKAETRDTVQVQLLEKIARTYSLSRPDSALIMAQKGLKLARKIKYLKGEAACLNVVGSILGNMGNYAKALETHLQVLKIRESINDQAKMLVTYINIGNVYSDQGDLRKSLIYYFKAKTIAQSTQPDNALLPMVNIGDCYEELNQLDSAYFFTYQAYKMAVRLEQTDIVSGTLNNLGNIYSKMGKSVVALKYYRRSLIDYTTENDDLGVAEVSIEMAYLFKKLNQPDSALHYGIHSLAAAKRGDFAKVILDASSFLSDLYEKMGRLDSAFAYQKITIASKDSLFGQEKVKALQSLGFAEQIRQQEITDAKVAADLELKKNLQMAGVGVFIPIFFGLILFISKRKVKPKTIEIMTLVAIMLLFEFVSMLMGPVIAGFSFQSPIIELLMTVCLALSLAPLDRKLGEWTEKKLAIT